MRDLLYLCHRIPYPPNKGDKIRAYHVLDFLQRHFRVHLGCFVDDADDSRHCGQLQALCASTCFVALRPAMARLASLRGYASGEALSLPYYRSRRLQQWVTQTLATQRIDTALAFSGPMGQYLPARTPHGPLRRVMDLVDVDSEKWRDYAGSRPWPFSLLFQREASRLLAAEQAIASRFDHVTLVSAAEAALFRQRAPESSHKVSFFSNGVDSSYFQPGPLMPNPYPAQQLPLVFTGAMDYWPNVQAVHWFAHAVLPSVRLQWPQAHFHIVGARPVPAVIALGRLPGVSVSGTVPDVRPYLQHAALAVAPLRIARGIQNKVLEAMAMQKAVVATPQALEGIHAAGKELLCAADAGEFIHQVHAVLADPAAAQRMGDDARSRILTDYAWQRNLSRLGHLLDVDGASLNAAVTVDAGCRAIAP